MCACLSLSDMFVSTKGFLDLRLKPWLRNLLTRCLAIVPSLIVAVIGGSAGAGKLIIIASVRYIFAYPTSILLPNQGISLHCPIFLTYVSFSLRDSNLVLIFIGR